MWRCWASRHFRNKIHRIYSVGFLLNQLGPSNLLKMWSGTEELEGRADAAELIPSSFCRGKSALPAEAVRGVVSVPVWSRLLRALSGIFSVSCCCRARTGRVVLAVAVRLRHEVSWAPHGQLSWSSSEAVVKGHWAAPLWGSQSTVSLQQVWAWFTVPWQGSRESSHCVFHRPWWVQTVLAPKFRCLLTDTVSQ